MEPEDVKKIAAALLPELKLTIQNEVSTSHEGLSTQISSVNTKVDALKVQVDPISEVYNSLSGGGTFFMWIFRNVIVPISVIIGIFLAWHNLNK